MILSAEELSILVERAERLASNEEVDDVPEDIFTILEEDMLESALDMEIQLKFRLRCCGRSSPGYLERFMGEWRIFAPWHMSEALPEDHVIALYLDIGSGLAASPREGLNISGSAALSGAGIEIGDLDFSQYIGMLGVAVSKELVRLRHPSPERLLLRASYGMRDATRSRFPWNDWTPFISEISSCCEFKDSKRIMLEFVVKSERLGLVPSSIVLMMCDYGDRTVGASRFSFVFQELVGVAAALRQPKWSMIDPPQLGAYILMLLEQMRAYRFKDPIKGVKRGLSIAYLLGLSDAADAAVALLQDEGVKADVRRKRHRDVSDLLNLLDGHSVDEWSDARGSHDALGADVVDAMPSSHVFDGFFSALAESLAREGLTGSRWEI